MTSLIHIFDLDRIFVISQDDDLVFNRAMLFNVGYMEASLTTSCPMKEYLEESRPSASNISTSLTASPTSSGGGAGRTTTRQRG